MIGSNIDNQRKGGSSLPGDAPTEPMASADRLARLHMQVKLDYVFSQLQK